MRLINDCLLFLQGDRRASVWGGLKVIHVNFDKIGSVLKLYPHLFTSFIRRVHQVEVTGTSGRTPHTFRRDDHPRPGDYACVDCSAKVHIGSPAARQVSRSGKARLKVELRILRGQEHDKWWGKRRSRLNDQR